MFYEENLTTNEVSKYVHVLSFFFLSFYLVREQVVIYIRNRLRTSYIRRLINLHVVIKHHVVFVRRFLCVCLFLRPTNLTICFI